MFLKDTQTFIELFNLDSQKLYYEPIVIRDVNIGFSIKRDYPDNIRFKPPTNRNGKPDDLIIIWLVYNSPIDSATNEIKKIPLYIKISKHSRFKSKYFDYDFNNPESPTKESLYQSEKTPKPLELEFIDYFFYDHNQSIFVDRSGKRFSGIELLNFVVNKHIDTVHLFKGLKFRFRLAFKVNTVTLLSPMIKFCLFSLKQFFGRELDKSDSVIALYEGFSPKDLKRSTTDVMEIFGYRTSKKVIILFCLIIIIITAVIYLSVIEIDYFNFIIGNHLLILTHSIIILILLDNVLPRLVFGILNFLIKKRNKILFSKFKF